MHIDSRLRERSGGGGTIFAGSRFRHAGKMTSGVDFARGMAPMMIAAAQRDRRHNGRRQRREMEGTRHRRRTWTIRHHARSKKNPNAEIVALDWDKVLTVAEEKCPRLWSCRPP